MSSSFSKNLKKNKKKFIIARTRTQRKCPSMEEWIKKVMVHIYTMEYYSVIKKNDILPFATTWLDTEIVILNEEVRER